MNIVTKILLIKKLRSMAFLTPIHATKLDSVDEGDGITFHVTVSKDMLSLKFCKEFVEECMAYGVERYKSQLRDDLHFNQTNE